MSGRIREEIKKGIGTGRIDGNYEEKEGVWDVTGGRRGDICANRKSQNHQQGVLAVMVRSLRGGSFYV